jgi:hypothetical protein
LDPIVRQLWTREDGSDLPFELQRFGLTLDARTSEAIDPGAGQQDQHKSRGRRDRAAIQQGRERLNRRGQHAPERHEPEQRSRVMPLAEGPREW